MFTNTLGGSLHQSVVSYEEHFNYHKTCQPQGVHAHKHAHTHTHTPKHVHGDTHTRGLIDKINTQI